ncbi:unnamed protein product, partial [Pylaiella littoralis]
CSDVDEDDDKFNTMLVSPDGLYVYVAGEDTVKAYRTHTDVPTPAPTTAATPGPTRGEAPDCTVFPPLAWGISRLCSVVPVWPCSCFMDFNKLRQMKTKVFPPKHQNLLGWRTSNASFSQGPDNSCMKYIRSWVCSYLWVFSNSSTLMTASCTSDKSCITLLHGGVRTTANAVLSSVGSTPVLAPDNPSTVSAVLIAPQEVGLCGEFTLDGRASSGAASRTLSATWNVSNIAATGSASAVAAFEDALAPFQGSLLATLDASALEFGVEFTLTLTTGNFLGAVDTTAVSLTRINDDIPLIVVVGSATKIVKRSSPTMLQVVATPPACGEASALSYTWVESGVSGYDELGAITFESLLGSDPTAVVVPAYTLGYPGSNYLFKAATPAVGCADASYLVQVTVVQGNLRAFISGGQHRQHTEGERSDLTLDGSGSWDEDDIPESQFPLRHSWTCLQNCSRVAGGFTSSEESVFTIPAGNLEARLMYVFSLNISKGTEGSDVAYGLLRSAVTTVQVDVVSFEAPEVFVAAKDDGEKLDPTRKAVIYGGIDEQSTGYDLMWTQVSGDLDIDAEGWSKFFTTAQIGANLVTRPNVLTGGLSYTFRLSAIDAVSLETGFAELSVMVNAAPTGGRIEATPRAGVAALDTFTLESLDWSDDVDDLPLVFSFSYINGQNETGTQFMLSVSEIQSVEWRGPLPIGRSADNYTMTIVGHVSDTYGATATSTKDLDDEFVSVHVTGWEASSNGSALLDALTQGFTAAAEADRGIPGETTYFVRAYASLLVKEINANFSGSSEQVDDYQARRAGEATNVTLVGLMVSAVMDDFGILEYSTTSAGAAFDTLALLSTGGDALSSASQEVLLASSASILDEAIEDGYWDSTIMDPTLQLLDGVIGSYGSSFGDVVSSVKIGDGAANIASMIVDSMTTLMEASLVDGEEATTIQSDYIQASCVVTSSEEPMTFKTGSSSVVFGESAIGSSSPASTRRRTTTSGRPQEHSCTSGGCTQRTSQRLESSRRKLDEIVSTSPSTIVVAHLLFSANGGPSSSVDGAGVTQIKITSTSSGEHIPLAAPVAMTMKASVTSEAQLPACSFFNEDTNRWDSEGLALDSATMSSHEGNGVIDYDVSCVSFHLSYFTVTTTEVEPGFQPVTLTAVLDAILAREISTVGIALTAGVLLLFGLIWGVSRRSDHRLKTAIIIENKVVDWYIATGESIRRPTLPGLTSLSEKQLFQRKRRKQRYTQIRRRYPWHRLQRRLFSWYRLCRTVIMHVAKHHPWAGMVSPGFSSLTLSRKQLSLLIFAQVMVQMMVDGCFLGESSDHKIKATRILAGLVATLPASIIIPRAFAASAFPPASITVGHDWKQRKGGSRKEASQRGLAQPFEYSPAWLREPNNVLAVSYLFRAQMGGRRSSQTSTSHSSKTGKTLARGTTLTIYGIVQLLLNIVCGLLYAFIGVNTNLDMALVVIVSCSHVQNILSLDALFANKATKFSIMSSRMLFNLGFVNLVLMTLQVGLAFHKLRTSETGIALPSIVFGISIVKLFICNLGELMPCMDAINEHGMMQLKLTKKYRRTSTVRRGVSDQSQLRMLAHQWAAAVIQARMRQVLERKRFIRRKEVLAWHGGTVVGIRRTINNRAYMFLAAYTLVVVWINLCYVVTYDTPTTWNWVTHTAITVIVDVLLRKPLSVLVLSAFYTFRSMVHAPHESYIGTKKW